MSAHADRSDATWSGPAIGLLDLDAFFASVEQLDHPEWRGLPVIVGGSADERGVVSTASYEARVFGVHSAMSAAEARRRCPNAIWVRGNFVRYHEVSDQVMAVICDETPLVEQVSIDEAFFDVTPGRYSRETPREICARIQRRVAELGVTCSIGLSTSKTVAKVASEQDKPRGLTVVEPGREEAFLAPLPVRALSGIGKRTAATLALYGIHTLGDLAAQNPHEMERILGVWGPRMVERARGQERSEVRAREYHEDPKSVSNERTFPRDLTCEEELHAAIAQISEKVGARLRRRGLKGNEVTLKLKFDALHVRTAQTRLTAPTDDEHVFGPAARRLLGGLWAEPTPVRLVGVGMSGFDDTGGTQLTLFELDEDQGLHVSAGTQASADAADGERPAGRDMRALSEVTDRLRERFGNDAIRHGYDLRLQRPGDKSRPNRT